MENRIQNTKKIFKGGMIVMPRYENDKDATKIYSKEQIEYMKSIGLDFDYSNMTDENWCKIENTVGNKLTLECLDENDNPNKEGLFCYSILDLLPTDD
jgi:hypothetical protein